MKRNVLGSAGLLVVLFLSAASLRAQTLAEALESNGLVWTTSGQVGWGVGNSFMTVAGADCAVSGNIDASQESVLQTTVTNGPGTLSFWWKVFSETNADFLEFSIVGVLTNAISGNEDWQFRSYEIPSGFQMLQWRYRKNETIYIAPDQGWLDQVIYTTTPPLPLGQALDTFGLAWTSGGNTNSTFWAGLPNQTVLGGVTNLAHDGVDSAQSGAIFHSQESWMETTVSGVTNVSFWWKVSSEAGFDFLQFYINGVLKTNISGEVGWQKNSYAISTNTQTLRWRYYKDDSNTEGQDRGWVDQVVIAPNTGAPLPFSLASPNRLPDGRFQLTLSSEELRNYRILVSTNLVNWNTLTNITSSNANTIIVDAAASNSTARFYQGVTP